MQCIITDTKLYQVAANGSDTESIEYYLKNTRKYFSSNSQLRFKPGEYYLSSDLVIKNVINFSLTGESFCKITCALYSSVVILNVTNLLLDNITFKNCNKNFSAYLHATFDYDHVSISMPSCNASLLLYNCTSVVISNISVLVTAGTTGLLVVNVKGHSTLTNVSIIVNYTICPTKDEHPEQINGILFYYDYWCNKTTDMELDNFQFITNETCSHPLQYAITLLLFQKNTTVSFSIKNTNFIKLKNVKALYYYGETCGMYSSNNLMLTNCNISKNTGDHKFYMFTVILYNRGCFNTALLKQFCCQQYNNISFIDCEFAYNHNITSMIHITPASSRAITGYIYIMNSSFRSNINTHFFNLESDRDNVWQLSNAVFMNSLEISTNIHFEGQNLISCTNCWMMFTGTTFITNNTFFENIIKLHISAGIFQNAITITQNTARQILDSSYILIMENTTVNVSYNTVYMVAKQTLTMGSSTRPVCGVQFYSKQGDLDSLNATKLPFEVMALNNTHMTSKKLLGKRLLSSPCQWLAGTAFYIRNSVEIYSETFNIQNLVVDNGIKRPVPLSVCKCQNLTLDNKSVDCYSPYLGSIFPGETVTVQLSVQEKWIGHSNSSTAIVAEYASGEDDCSIVHASELSQSHFNDINKCNSYSYTLWPKNVTVKECQLFIGLHNMPEMFYVQVKPCPKGFTYQNQRKACYCDPLLSTLSITSCNIKDETILRPANSWIYAHTHGHENSYTFQYQVSLHCPFHHCLSESSHLNLSDPYSQCQFNRTGFLCSDCKPGLSVILGTPQCKPCSDMYLLLLIPIVMTGVALVIIFYAFNFTVWIGTVNTLAFYVSIVKINILTFFPGCQSITCMIFSHLNLNFRTNTCFYNGMDDYAKEWISLAHNFYCIGTSIIFIVLSRYSTKIQRLTARRALPVLATLILFSYTKILIITCNVLFQYTSITHLPSNKTELVWSVSATTPLFGSKFLALFIVCIILFVILTPFNVILLFTRKLSRFKLVTKLKPLLDAYFSAYKDKAYYWTGLLLLIRVIVFILSTFENDISFIATSILLAGLLCLHGVVKPFKSKFHNIQESIAIVNLLAVHVLTLYKKDLLGLKVAQILLEIGLAYFIMAITIHCCMYRWGGTIYKCIKWLHRKIRKMKSSQEKIPDEMETFSRSIPEVTYNYEEFREPLVEYDN